MIESSLGKSSDSYAFKAGGVRRESARGPAGCVLSTMWVGLLSPSTGTDVTWSEPATNCLCPADAGSCGRTSGTSFDELDRAAVDSCSFLPVSPPSDPRPAERNVRVSSTTEWPGPDDPWPSIGWATSTRDEFGFAPRRVHVLEREEERDMRGREETLLTIVVLVHFRAWP
jgi:hypothetical protein